MVFTGVGLGLWVVAAQFAGGGVVGGKKRKRFSAGGVSVWLLGVVQFAG